MFLSGVVLSALFQRYAPADLVARPFGDAAGRERSILITPNQFSRARVAGI